MLSSTISKTTQHLYVIPYAMYPPPNWQFRNSFGNLGEFQVLTTRLTDTTTWKIMLRLVIWPSMMLLGWAETKLWTLKYSSKSIQTSPILRQRPPKPYKLFKFLLFLWCSLKWANLAFSSHVLSNSRCMTGFYSCHKTDKKFEEFTWFWGTLSQN